MEKTLKLKNPALAAPPPKPRPNFPRIATAFLLSALLAAITVGKLTRPSRPKPELIPRAPSPAAAPALPAESPQRPTPRPHLAATNTGERNAKFLACRFELEAKRVRLPGKSPFPACTRAFSESRDCGPAKREFLEAVYLYAYAFAADAPAEAKSILREAIPLFAGCAESLPLRQRALELDLQLSRRRRAEVR